MKSATLLFLLALGAVASTEVLDLGDMSRYSPREGTKSPRADNTVWLSGNEADGYDITLSQDTRDKVHDILFGCGKMDNSCYQEVYQVLRSAHVEIDNRLERRGFVQLLTKTFRKFSTVAGSIAMVLVANWMTAATKEPPNLVFVPVEIASQAPKLAEATEVVISAEGTAVVTVTPTPDPTQLRGSQTPSVTPVADPDDFYKEGDLIAVLDRNLAPQIDEIMHRSQECEDGQKFDRIDKPGRRRADGTYGKAICAAEAAVIMANRGGPLNDLLLLNTGHVTFDFAEAAGAVTRASNVVTDFVLAYAPMLDISPDLAEQLGNLLFALAVNTIMEGRAIIQNNRIPAASITTDEPSPTSCPNPEETELICGFSEEDDDCELKMPEISGKDPTCKSGKYKGCKCLPPNIFSRNIASDEEQKAMIHISKLLKEIGSVPRSPECSHKDLSVIPSNVFGSEQNNVYHEFCESWFKIYPFHMTVDAAGKNKEPKPQLKHAIEQRAPPPNPAVWDKYDFKLAYKPNKLSLFRKCSATCGEAFSQLTRACRNTGSVGTVMAKKGQVDVGCGVFEYSIESNTTPLKAFTRQCFRHDEFGDVGDVHGSRVKELTATPCWGSGIDPIKRGDPSTFRSHSTVSGGVPYQLNIYWKDGCTLDGTDELLPSNPLNIKNQDGRFCQETLYDNWKQCNNKGVGGRIQVGCLVYEFKAEKKD